MCVEPGEELVRVVRDLEEPVGDLAPLDRGARAPAAAVDDLLVGEHGAFDRIPVDLGVALVREPLLVHPAEHPLLPAVVVRGAGGELAGPVVAEAEPPELGLHVRDVPVRPLRGRHPVLDRRVLGRQPEGVPAHRLEHVLAEHPLVARDHVADRVVADVAHVQAPARVGEHREAVELLAGRVLGDAEGLRLLPVVLRRRLDRLGLVALGEGGGAAVLPGRAGAGLRRAAVPVPCPAAAVRPVLSPAFSHRVRSRMHSRRSRRRAAPGRVPAPERAPGPPSPWAAGRSRRPRVPRGPGSRRAPPRGRTRCARSSPGSGSDSTGTKWSRECARAHSRGRSARYRSRSERTPQYRCISRLNGASSAFSMMALTGAKPVPPARNTTGRSVSVRR